MTASDTHVSTLCPAKMNSEINAGSRVSPLNASNDRFQSGWHRINQMQLPVWRSRIHCICGCGQHTESGFPVCWCAHQTKASPCYVRTTNALYKFLVFHLQCFGVDTKRYRILIPRTNQVIILFKRQWNMNGDLLPDCSGRRLLIGCY